MCFSQSIQSRIILNPALSRKRKHPNYKSLDSYFQVDGQSMRSEGHCSNSTKDDFRVKYFEALDLIMASLRTRFDQPRFIALSNLESYLIQSVKGQGIVDEKII